MVSIIIVNYNQKDWLKKCLKQIKEAKIKLPYEIIVVDNASKDGSEVVIEGIREEVSNLRVIRNKKNLGYAGGVNQGIKESKGDYLLIINPDVLIVPGSVEELVEFIETHKEVGIMGPQLRGEKGNIQDSCLAFPKWYTPFVRRTFLKKFSFARKELKRYLMEDFDHQETREVDWLLGAALIARKETIKKVGLMDERFFLYFEDVDWCRRFKEKGFKVIYYPKVSLFHYYQRLSAQNKGLKAILYKVTWIHIISAIKYFWKWK